MVTMACQMGLEFLYQHLERLLHCNRGQIMIRDVPQDLAWSHDQPCLFLCTSTLWQSLGDEQRCRCLQRAIWCCVISVPVVPPCVNTDAGVLMPCFIVLDIVLVPGLCVIGL